MALRDPRIGEALAAIHGRLARDWDVSALAKRAGMSRTAFAVRFAELVGEPPAHYLARCRMNEAAALLEASTATIAQIAERVGYASELGFSRAFKRFIGTTPASHRRRSLLHAPRPA